MSDWKEGAEKISEMDEAWRQKARLRLREQTRPEGSLGILESLLERLAAIQKKAALSVKRKQILIFAADHGVTEEGVSLYPKQVTQAMVLNFLNGGATINALARAAGAEVKVIDMGVDADFPLTPHPALSPQGRGQGEGWLIHAKVRRGTRNMTREPAMTAEELDQTLETGWGLAWQAHQEGVELLGLGEMGIGNTTSASAVTAALLNQPVEAVTGRGTGLNDAVLRHKIEVIRFAHSVHQRSLTTPLEILRCLGGYEISAMTGAILGAARFGLPVVIDGWIVSAAALAAVRINPKVLDYLFFAHQSGEQGHALLLETLEAKPLLNLSMRLGEASGAALAMGIIEAAVRVYNETATFAEAGVAKRER